MNRTSSVETSIHATSPLSMTGSASWAMAGAAHSSAARSPMNVLAFMFVVPFLMMWLSERVFAGLAGAHPQDALEVEHEDLSVADLAGARGLCDGLDRGFGQCVRHRRLELDLTNEVHRVFGTAVDLGVTRLRAEALDLRHHHPPDTDGDQRLADLVELVGLECCDDEFHDRSLPISSGSCQTRSHQLRRVAASQAQNRRRAGRSG